MKKLIGYFLKGLLFVVPLVITIYVIYFVFIRIDGLFRFSGINIPGVGFVITILLITFIGFLASTIFTRSLLNFLDNIFKRLPFIKLLYTSAKDLMGAFIGEKKFFDKPVLVSLLPDSETKVIGFITREDLNSLDLSGSVAVYMPQAYNFAGNLIIVPKDRITPINKDGSEVMAFVVSAGVSGKDQK